MTVLHAINRITSKPSVLITAHLKALMWAKGFHTHEFSSSNWGSYETISPAIAYACYIDDMEPSVILRYESPYFLQNGLAPRFFRELFTTPPTIITALGCLSWGHVSKFLALLGYQSLYYPQSNEHPDINIEEEGYDFYRREMIKIAANLEHEKM